MARLIQGIVAVGVFGALCGIAKVKVLDPIAENKQDVEDLLVLISDLSGKEN